MPDVLIRNLDAETVAYWKRRASEHRRSLQAELAVALEEIAARDERDRYGTFLERTGALRERFRGRDLGDSSAMLREDRDSDYGHPDR
ncbi:MAG: hypothetical protein HY875_16145 [Chloroflexi bacterium]|nr:hypothetical protein [Chloroflexota bacterium]